MPGVTELQTNIISQVSMVGLGRVNRVKSIFKTVNLLE
jgi:hypothetical protein